MSFFTGKPSGSSMCHITKGQHNRNTMAGAPFDATVFHTDINYLEYRMYDLSDYRTSDRTHNAAYNSIISQNVS